MVNLLEAYIPNTWLNNEIKLLAIDIRQKFLRLLKKETNTTFNLCYPS